jgi:hypothetical protein
MKGNEEHTYSQYRSIEEATMPSVRRLSPAEIAVLEQRPLGARTQVAREYDAYVADFVAGDYGRGELAADERRTVVRGRLQAAARRRGLALRFRPGPGAALIFRVEAAPPPLAKPAATPAAGAGQRHDGAARRDGAPPRPPRRRQSAAARYHEVLPRWMREGNQPGRQDGSKRRSRGR